MHLPSFISVLLATYWTVLVSELIGDKTIYTIASLASRYSPAEVYAGITVAFMGKMLFAVLCAQLLIHIPVNISVMPGNRYGNIRCWTRLVRSEMEERSKVVKRFPKLLAHLRMRVDEHLVKSI